MVLLFHANNKGGSCLPSIYKGRSGKDITSRNLYFQDKFHANPHTAFENRNCPKDTESRISVESRVALYFWQMYSKINVIISTYQINNSEILLSVLCCCRCCCCCKIFAVMWDLHCETWCQYWPSHGQANTHHASPGVSCLCKWNIASCNNTANSDPIITPRFHWHLQEQSSVPTSLPLEKKLTQSLSFTIIMWQINFQSMKNRYNLG